MTNTTYTGRVPHGDEINLVELLHGLWAQKWLIALTALVVTLGAASYALLSKPVYETRIAMLPPTLSDIAGFNVARGGKSGLEPFSVDDIYSVFAVNFQSKDSRRQFFRDVYLPSLSDEERSGSKDSLYKLFSSEFKIEEDPSLAIVIEHQKPAQAAEWAKYYVEKVTQHSLDEVLQNTQREVEVRGKQIQQEIKSLRESARALRYDRIVKLKEALAIAEAVGLESPPVISGQIAQQLSAFMDGNLMYMRGTKALRAELGALESRTSDDPFIPSLRSLEEQYNFISGLRVTRDGIAVSRQDGEVVIPDKPIKPKKALILVLGALLGGMLGLFVALVRLMLSRHSVVNSEGPISTSLPTQAT